MKPSLIVSFTSHPARIHVVPQVLESLYAQSMRPDRILLWLAEEQFPNHEADLPKELIDDAAAGKFELRWCDDLGSHKKYFYTIQEFPDDIVVIVDDDQYYHSDTIKTLYESYLRHPLAVSALRTHLVLFDDGGEVLPYPLWHGFFIGIVDTPSTQLVAVGCGGVLYPPHRLDVRVFDREAIQNLCTRSDGIVTGDDIWLKMHAALCGTPVVLASKEIEHKTISNTQMTALWATTLNTFNSRLVNAIRKHYEKEGDDILLRCLQQAMKEPTYQVTIMEDLPQGRWLWLCAAGDLKKDSLPPMQYDFNELWQYVKFRLALCNQLMAYRYTDKAYEDLKILQKMLRLTPEIQSWAERSQEVEIRAFYDHGAVLRTKLWGDFRQTKNYLQMAQNWREFLAAHPDCEGRYFDGYRRFIDDMYGAIAEMGSDGVSSEELEKCQEVLENGIALFPKVSVIIPVWNPGPGISRCVESLRGQTLEDIEMLFVDDCGTDGAMDVVRAAAAEDPRIRIIENPHNLGRGASRNVAIEVARGVYIAFVDPDDYIDPGFLEVLYQKGKTENLDIVKGSFLCESEDGTVSSNAFKLNDAIQKRLKNGSPIFCCFIYEFPSALYHKKLFVNSKVRFALTSVAADTTFLLKVCHVAKHLGIDERVAYHYLRRMSSASNSFSEDSLEARAFALRDQAEYLSNHVEPNPYAVQYITRKLKYLLSKQRFVAKIGMEKEAAQFLLGLRKIAKEYPNIGKVKDMTILALVDYGVGLPEWPYHSPWEVAQPEDYLDVIANRAKFIMVHPKHYKEWPKLVSLSESFVKRMEAEGIPLEEIEVFKQKVKALLSRPWMLWIRLKYRCHNK